jgi:hypothetical protein
VAVGVSVSSIVAIVSLLGVASLIARLRRRIKATSHGRGSAAESVAKYGGARKSEPKRNGRGAEAVDKWIQKCRKYSHSRRAYQMYLAGGCDRMYVWVKPFEDQFVSGRGATMSLSTRIE